MDLAVQRQLTLAFIDQKPVDVVLTPHTRERTPTGGYKEVAGPPRDPITLTFVETSAQGGWPKPVPTLDGVERVAEMEIVAPWGSPIAVDDTFTFQGKDWEVIGVFFDNEYETRALVASRGR